MTTVDESELAKLETLLAERGRRAAEAAEHARLEAEERARREAEARAERERVAYVRAVETYGTDAGAVLQWKARATAAPDLTVAAILASLKTFIEVASAGPVLYQRAQNSHREVANRAASQGAAAPAPPADPVEQVTASMHPSVRRVMHAARRGDVHGLLRQLAEEWPTLVELRR